MMPPVTKADNALTDGLSLCIDGLEGIEALLDDVVYEALAKSRAKDPDDDQAFTKFLAIQLALRQTVLDLRSQAEGAAQIYASLARDTDDTALP